MNTKTMSGFLALTLVFVRSMHAWAEEYEPVYPLKVSENHRFLIDQKGVPFFWLATTQWQLFHGQTVEEARTIMKLAKRNGVNCIQVKLLGPGNGIEPSEHGGLPFHDGNPLTPNEAYFKHVDQILEAAREINISVALTLYHQRWRKLITEQNGRAYGKWLAERYGHIPQIIWTSTPEAKPEFLAVLRELAAGIKSSDKTTHLMTCKPDPAPYSSSFAHDEPWMDYNCIQVWNHIDQIHSFITKDYARTPAKPVLMTEGAYEAGEEYRMNVTPLWVRRQAYYTVLLGAYHGYGHNSSWRMYPDRLKTPDSPGARQLGIMKKFFADRKQWWFLTPDQSILATGGVVDGNILNLAARHKDGLWVLAYLADKCTFSVDLSKVAKGPVKASWVDPRTGELTPVGEFPNSGVKEFTTPAGWTDSLLLLDSGGDQ